MGRYSEKGNWSDYKKNRRRVCEIYGVDPDKVSCHHIVFRSDVLTNPVFEDMDLNELSNLYPFADTPDSKETHTSKRDHNELHQGIGEREYKKGNWRRRGKRGKW